MKKRRKVLIGYRSWSVENGELGSVYMFHTLKPNTLNEAELCYRCSMCSYGSAENYMQLGRGCYGCGFHAFKSVISATGFGFSNSVSGLCALWGRVSEHKRGYRSQFMYPLCLFYGWFSGESRKLVREVADRYGIPAYSFFTYPIRRWQMWRRWAV